MGSWRKLLARMVADSQPRSYTYEQAKRVLENLDFELAPPEGSHRKFRRVVVDPASPSGKRTVVIGLKEAGSGKLKPKYITVMVHTLRENKMLPEGVDNP